MSHMVSPGAVRSGMFIMPFHGPAKPAAQCYDEDLELIGERGATVIHNPAANFRLGSGRAPVHKMRARGVSVALGTDGTASSDNKVVWTQVKLASLIHNDFSADRWVGSREAFAMATTGGARCLGRADEIGSLEPGKLADLALWRLDGLGQAGIEDPVLALVFGAAPPLELLTVGGSVVVERDELRTADEDGLATDLRRASREVAP